MSDKRHFVLQPEPHPSRKLAKAQIDLAPDGYHCVISEPSRTLPENSLLHALIGEVARKIEWAGKKRDAETWKRLLVAAWCRVHGESVEVLPALDGHGVDIVPARTSKLTKKECADLIEYIYAWGAENGITWDDYMQEQKYATQSV
jgi:hypothetical protein